MLERISSSILFRSRKCAFSSLPFWCNRSWKIKAPVSAPAINKSKPPNPPTNASQGRCRILPSVYLSEPRCQHTSWKRELVSRSLCISGSTANRRSAWPVRATFVAQAFLPVLPLLLFVGQTPSSLPSRQDRILQTHRGNALGSEDPPSTSALKAPTDPVFRYTTSYPDL